MTDVVALKASTDLLELVSRDTSLRKVSSSRGGEYAGPCPVCGGVDRFRVQPATGLWWCRRCRDRWGDAISYMMWRDRMTFPEAVRSLGGDALPRSQIARRPASAPPTSAPSKLWQARAEAVVRQASDTLWSDVGAKARSYLHARGLTDTALRWFGLGFIPEERWEDPNLWGLHLDPGKRVWIPRGIAIPWILACDDEVWCIKIRRSQGDPKYACVTGSVPTLFGTKGLRGRETLVLPEGEFDAMLAWQAAGDLVDVATLGPATKGIDPRARSYMLPYARIFVARDDDEAGERGLKSMLVSSPRMRRLAVPGVHDLSDFARQGGDVRHLISAAVEE